MHEEYSFEVELYIHVCSNHLFVCVCLLLWREGEGGRGREGGRKGGREKGREGQIRGVKVHIAIYMYMYKCMVMVRY